MKVFKVSIRIQIYDDGRVGAVWIMTEGGDDGGRLKAALHRVEVLPKERAFSSRSHKRMSVFLS